MIEKTLVSAVLKHGEDIAEKPAIILKKDIVTYGELKKRILNMACILDRKSVV